MTPPKPRFDMGRATDVLRIDYNQYPRQDRPTMLLRHLEDCIEPAPVTVPPPHRLANRVGTTEYLAMAGWLILTAIIGFRATAHLWPLEFLSLLLGIAALGHYFHAAPHHHRQEHQ